MELSPALQNPGPPGQDPDAQLFILLEFADVGIGRRVMDAGIQFLCCMDTVIQCQLLRSGISIDSQKMGSQIDYISGSSAGVAVIAIPQL